MMLSTKLMRNRISNLKRANKAATKRKQHKRKRIQRERVLIKGDREDLLAQRAEHQITHNQRQDGEQSGLSRQALARYKRCRETRHNSRTYKNDTLSTA
jgi:hypothetical protein